MPGDVAEELRAKIAEAQGMARHLRVYVLSWARGHLNLNFYFWFLRYSQSKVYYLFG